MKTVLFLVLIVSLGIGCGNTTTKKEVANQTSETSQTANPQYPSPNNKPSSNCDISSLNVEYLLKPPADLRPILFYDSMNIYCLPDETSEVLRTMKFRKSSYSLSSYMYANNDYWYKLKGWRPDFMDGGYIKASILSDFYSGLSKDHIGYLGKVIITPPEESNRFVIKRFDTQTNEVLQEYLIPNYLKYHKIEVIYNHTLKNVKQLMHFETEFDESPSSFNEEFIIEVNGQLVKLLAFAEENYDGDEYTENQSHKVYLPIRASGKVVLAPEGRFERILQKDLSLDLFEYSPNIGIPIEDLIVVEKTVSNNTNDEQAIFIEYYYWTGSQLALKDTVRVIGK